MKLKLAVAAYVCMSGAALAQTYGQVQWGLQLGTTTPNLTIYDGTVPIVAAQLNKTAHTISYPSLNVTGAVTAASVTANTLTLNGGTTTSTAILNDTGTQPAPAIGAVTMAFQVLMSDSYASYAELALREGVLMRYTKNDVGVDTTGSRVVLRIEQLGVGGPATGDVAHLSHRTGVGVLINPTPSSGGTNNGGAFTGINPVIRIPSGMTPDTAVGEEIDLQLDSEATLLREGLRIASSNTKGAITDDDAGINILRVPGQVPWKRAIEFGATPNTLPVSTGGTLIWAVGSAADLDAGIDLSNLTGTPTKAYIVLPSNRHGIYFASDASGGAIISGTPSDGGKFVFGSGAVSIRNINNDVKYRFYHRITTSSGIEFSDTTDSSVEISAIGNGSNIDISMVPKGTGATVLGGGKSLKATSLVASGTAPTIASGFCTSPTIAASNGTWAFSVNVGTGCGVGTGTITMPAAATNWVCSAHNVTTPDANNVKFTGGTSTTITLKNYSQTTGAAANFPDNEVIRIECLGE